MHFVDDTQNENALTDSAEKFTFSDVEIDSFHMSNV